MTNIKKKTLQQEFDEFAQEYNRLMSLDKDELVDLILELRRGEFNKKIVGKVIHKKL